MFLYPTLANNGSDWIMLGGENLSVKRLTGLISRVKITGIPIGLGLTLLPVAKPRLIKFQQVMNILQVVLMVPL